MFKLRRHKKKIAGENKSAQRKKYDGDVMTAITVVLGENNKKVCIFSGESGDLEKKTRCLKIKERKWFRVAADDATMTRMTLTRLLCHFHHDTQWPDFLISW